MKATCSGIWNGSQKTCSEMSSLVKKLGWSGNKVSINALEHHKTSKSEKSADEQVLTLGNAYLFCGFPNQTGNQKYYRAEGKSSEAKTGFVETRRMYEFCAPVCEAFFSKEEDSAKRHTGTYYEVFSRQIEGKCQCKFFLTIIILLFIKVLIPLPYWSNEMELRCGNCFLSHSPNLTLLVSAFVQFWV